jgi:hypothetical protein
MRVGVWFESQPRTPTITTDACRGFSQSLQENSEIVHYVRATTAILYGCVYSSKRSICPAHLVVLDFTARKTV